jgi:hypothetical protein
MPDIESPISHVAVPEGFSGAQQLPSTATVSQPKKWRRGDVGPDGRVFAGMQNGGEGGKVPWWVTPEHYERRRKAFNDARKKRYAEDPAMRAKMLASSKELGKLKYHCDPEWKAAKNAANAGRMRERRSTDASFVAQCSAKAKIRAAMPEARERRRQRERGLAASDPCFAAVKRLRCRIRSAIRRGVVASEDSRGTRQGAAFLVWLAKRMCMGKIGPSLHIDHVWPLSAWAANPYAGWVPNGPENVRWIGASQNIRKHARLPTAEEVAEHLTLVAEWKKETESEKSE